MKKLILALSVVVLTGCSSMSGLVEKIPSFWDDNQSAAIVTIAQSVRNIDCKESHAPQLYPIQQKIEWFIIYSEAKGARQNDVIKLVDPMKKTVDDFLKRSTEKQGSEAYCESKKRIMTAQSTEAAKAVLYRF
jgi:uncharacterized protein YceK